MEFTETKLSGAFIVRQKRIQDHRGYFARAWCSEEFKKHGLNPRMVQANVGFSRIKGTLRGMHFQAAPHAEAKLIKCTRGAAYDVIVDLRERSPTRGRWIGVELTDDNDILVYAPEGFAHGYITLADNTEIQYMTSAPYAPREASGVRFDDPAFDITWPVPVTVISDQDRQWADYGR